MSVYNVRKYDYGEFVQFRVYEKSIKTKDEKKRDITFDNFEKHLDELESFYDPIVDNGKQMDFKDYEEEKYFYEKKKKHSQTVSVNRSIQSIYEYTYANKWDYFITLTFDPEKVDRMNYDEIVKKTTKWLNNQKNRKANDLKYIFIPEKHKDGAYHVHALIANCGDMSFEDSGRVAIGKKSYKRNSTNEHYPIIYNLDGWKFGWSTATAVQDNAKCCSYMAKYVTKDLCAETFRKRRFYPSRNVQRAEVTDMNVFPEDMDDYILEKMFENKIEYYKEQTVSAAHQKVKYFTIKKENL